MKLYNPWKRVWLDQDVRAPGPTKGLVGTHPFVDLHTHVRLNTNEDYRSLESAALAGGFSTLVIQPNTHPPLRDRAALETHQRLVKELKVTILWAADFFGDLEIDPENGVVSYSTDGSYYTHEDLVRAFKKREKGLLFDHSQIHELDGDFYEGTDLPFSKRPLSNEAIAVYRTVLTGMEYGFDAFHIQHVTTAFALDSIVHLKRYARVTCEVTPHHLLLTMEDINSTNKKVNPPFGRKEDREALIRAVERGIVDALATDHAPHPEKGEDFLRAPFGTSIIEVAFSAYYTALRNIELVFEKLTVGPLKVLGKAGEFCDRNLVFVDPEAEFVVDTSRFFSKGKNCALEGMKLMGRVVGVKLSGRWVYWDGEFLSDERQGFEDQL